MSEGMGGPIVATLESDGTQTAFTIVSGVAAVVIAVVVIIFWLVRDRAMHRDFVELQKAFTVFKADLQEQNTKKVTRYNKSAAEFLKQYKKPILQSCFDLQSRLTNQVHILIANKHGYHARQVT